MLVGVGGFLQLFGYQGVDGNSQCGEELQLLVIGIVQEIECCIGVVGVVLVLDVVDDWYWLEFGQVGQYLGFVLLVQVDDYY